MPDPNFAALAWLMPGVLLAAALLVRLRPALAWGLGERAMLAAPVLALVAYPALTPVSRVMAFLVAGLGAVTLRFSRRYLDAEPDAPRYVHWFLLAVAGAATVVVAGDLVVVGLAWTLTSLALHQLLTVGPARAAAEVAAHKKFLLSRVADLAVALGVLLIATAFGTTEIARILAAAGDLPTQAGLGTMLLAGAIVLRSAQLPFHGWLIQVMEAPTPVSALLHAGIINLGAFVAIRLGALFLAAPGALALLAIFGLASATMAALVMRTRGSVKGTLAWSTCAQMGFVLVEVGLGAFDLALLHIVAHGAYKAHAFLASGSGVSAATERRADIAPPSALRWMVAVVLAPALVYGAALASGTAAMRPSTLLSAVVLTLGLLPAIARLPLQTGWRPLRSGLALILGLPALYAGWHAALTPVVPVPETLPLPLWFAGLVLAGFGAATLLQAHIEQAPQGALARRLYPHALNGFHLDALFTRLTFRLWPPTITPTAMRQRRERSTLRYERAA